MKLHPEDFAAASAHAQGNGEFPLLTPEQLQRVRAAAKAQLEWLERHRSLHNTLSSSLVVALLLADLAALWLFPALLLEQPLLAGLVAGALHGFLICGIETYTLHEGAAHDRIILGSGPVARALRSLAHNVPRLFFAVPDYYAAAHGAHHRDLGTSSDESFTHFVDRKRLIVSLLPAAPVLSLSDFFPWRPQEHTPSRRLSMRIGTAWMLMLAAVAAWRFGVIVAVIAVLFGSWLGPTLDRLRESTEHSFMPLDRVNGSRELGLGFWGLLLGGGPWGQPCHLTHHLAPALPWYQQISLHLRLRRWLTPEQTRSFVLRPIVGGPALLWQLFRSQRAQ